MAPKRGAPGAALRALNKRRCTAGLVRPVVNALMSSKALPEDLQELFEHTLPMVLTVNKADRHSYEVEVVEQAEKALALVGEGLQKSHAEALAKQNEVIAPAEHAQRTSAKKAAEESLEAANAKLEAKREGKEAAKKAVDEAQSSVKAAEKEVTKTEKQIQAIADKKTKLSNVLANEFVLCKEGTMGNPAVKKAVKTIEKLGNEFSFDATLLQTLPIACKKEPASRTEFEEMMFTSLQKAFDGKLEGFTQELAALEPSKAQAEAAVATAKDEIGKAETAHTAAKQEVSESQQAQKDASKAFDKASEHLYNLWGDMKLVCDAQDDIAKEIKYLKDNVSDSFQKLKDLEPEPEPVEEPEPAASPAPEGAEAAPEAEAAAPDPADIQ